MSLLYQVATAVLTPSDIAWPVSSILRAQRNARVVLGTVTGVDTDAREVRLHDESCHRYDWLVLATGASHNYFGNDGCAGVPPGLTRVHDATATRRPNTVAVAQDREQGERG